MLTTPDRVDAAALATWAQALLADAGVTPTDATLIARYMIEADERGFHSHGSDQMPSYVRGFRDGHLDATARPEVVRRTASIAVVDGHNHLGHVVADFATELAMSLARDTGIGMVTVRNSNHFGMAGHWPLKAVRAGLIGFTTTNGPPVMTPWGGRAGAICNNPFSWGIPAKDEFPILLDMALTAGARGRVRLAAQQGEAIPAGWALDDAGAPTTDASAALDGVMLPMGAHKGSGIAVVNEVLSSALSGAQFLTQITSTTMASSGVHVSWKIGHCFTVIDPAAFRPTEEFLEQVDAIIRGLKATEPAAGSDGVIMPGERGFRHAAEAARLGVPLAPGSHAKLSAFSAEREIAFPAVLDTTNNPGVSA